MIPAHPSRGIESVPRILLRWLSRSDHPTTPNKSNRKESSLPETPLGGRFKGPNPRIQLEFVILHESHASSRTNDPVLRDQPRRMRTETCQTSRTGQNHPRPESLYSLIERSYVGTRRMRCFRGEIGMLLRVAYHVLLAFFVVFADPRF